jgi:hypothetical protein
MTDSESQRKAAMTDEDKPWVYRIPKGPVTDEYLTELVRVLDVEGPVRDKDRVQLKLLVGIAQSLRRIANALEKQNK